MAKSKICCWCKKPIIDDNFIKATHNYHLKCRETQQRRRQWAIKNAQQ